jgi:hypothetical protein
MNIGKEELELVVDYGEPEKLTVVGRHAEKLLQKLIEYHQKPRNDRATTEDDRLRPRII